ncbi:MAG: hypothetical protein ACOCVX_03405 [Bacteroidales bacterium]
MERTDIQLHKIRQQFQSNPVHDLEYVLNNEFKKFPCEKLNGKSVGIAAGSRGINNIQLIIQRLVGFLKEQNASPFIFPAMGSHGGATAEGQLKVLNGLGITETAMGCPVKSSMEVVELNNDGIEARVFMDKYAYQSDGIILVNRIKPHTAYHDTYESGLVKMAVIGAGKHAQALEIHEYGVYGLKKILPRAAKKIFESGKIMGGIAIVEDGYDQTMHVEALLTHDIMNKEPVLLAMAKQNMPCLPVKDIDILIVDEIGKNISGTGIDTNIIGRNYIYGEPEPKSANINQLILLKLTPETQGNAVGMGLADIITDELYKAIDFQKTYENVYTSTFLTRAKIPVKTSGLKEALHYAFRAIGKHKTGNERIIRIKNTLQLEEVYVSENILEELPGNTQIVNKNNSLLDKTGRQTRF